MICDLCSFTSVYAVPAMKIAEKISLYRELAKLSQADFHLDRALDLLLAQKISPARRAWLSGLKRGLEEGHGVAESVRLYNGDTTTGLEVALIQAGETSGQMAPALRHLVEYFTALETAQQQMRTALIYPLILLHLAILLPELPAALITGDGSAVLGRAAVWVFLLWVGLIAFYLAFRALAERARSSPSADRLLNRIPWIGAARKHWALARFCQVAHACLLAALRMSETIRLAGEASQSGQMHQAAERAAKQVAAGESLSLALGQTAAFELAFVQSLATAEEAGGLDDELLRWGKAEALDAAQTMEQAARWWPRVAYGMVVLFVAWRIMTMVMGYYGGLLRQLQELG